MRAGIIGLQGCGKTLLLTYFASWFYFEKGIQIYSNYALNFPHFKIEEPEQILEIKDGFACLDELWLWLDSRCSGSKKNRIVSNILSQARKKQYSFGFTAQVGTAVDLRVRHICTHVYFPSVSNHQFIRVEGYRRTSLDWLWLKPFRINIFEIGKYFNTLQPTYDLEEKQK